jgi:hypothetical protein
MIEEMNRCFDYYIADSKPVNKSFGEWTVKWWQWAYSLPKYENPLTDSTGEFSSVGQSGEVWFLAGKPADMSNEMPIRKCLIPKNKSLLFPVMNCEANQIEFPDLSEKGLIENVATHMQLIAKKECYLDGVQMSVQRVRSNPTIFDLYITRDNVFGLQCGGHTRASADGFWVFLKPLEKGQHYIKFSGSCSGGIRKSGAEYHISVG